MRVRCIYQPGDGIPQDWIRFGISSETEWWGLAYGREYVVYGMLVWDGLLHLLVTPDLEHRDSPSWLPEYLFEVVNARLPSSWRFTFIRDNSTHLGSAIWGYPELAAPDTRHATDLVEREPEALQLFAARRKELDEEDAVENEILEDVPKHEPF